MNNIYVGTRIEHGDINRLMGTSISRMNEGLSKNLRSSVLKKGIKKTEQKKKLLFYSVDETLYQQLLKKDVDILVKVDGDELNKRLNEVNSRYPSRMDFDTSEKYKKELESEFENTVEVVGKDKNIRKKPVRKNDYLYKNTRIGKLIYETDGYKWSLGEVGDFFNYIFYKDYVKGFSFTDDPQSGEMETYEWNSSELITRNVFEKYKDTYRYLVKWSSGNNYSRVHLYENGDGEYSSSGGYSYDGFSNHSIIITTKPLTELYNEFRKLDTDIVEFCDYVMCNYCPYGFVGSFFDEYEPVRWNEVYDVIVKTFQPIQMKTQGEYSMDTPDREKVRDILLSNRGVNWMNLEFGLWIKNYILKEKVTKQNTLDFWFNDELFKMSRGIDENTSKETINEEYEKLVEMVSKNGRLEEVFNLFNP